MIRKSLCVLFLIIVPILLGQRNEREKRFGFICASYNQGCIYIILLTILLYLSCWINQWKFHVFERMFAASIIIGIIKVFYLKTIKKRGNKGKKYYSELFVKKILLFLIVLFLIAFQLSAYVFNGNFDQDDNTVEIVNTILGNDSFFNISPFTGETSQFIQPLYTPIILFYAFLSKISGLHPTLLIHIIVPCWILSWFSSICFEYGLELFDDKMKAIYFVIVIQILNMLGVYGKWLTSALLLCKAWQEESILLLCLLPWMVLRLFRIAQNKITSWEWLALVFQLLLIALFAIRAELYVGLLLVVALLIGSGRKLYELYRAY